MGCAWVWIPYMQYLSKQGIPCYAVSYRGHGESWHPSFFRMIYTTTKRALADDLVAGIKEAERRQSGEVVLVGHSSGGGLSQFILSEGDVKVKGLVLLGAVPGTGSLKCYLNWFMFDPWFLVRMVLHGFHTNSPLSHPSLTRQAFFSEEYPEAGLVDFQRHLCHYESIRWPSGMYFNFANPRKIMERITGGKRERVLVMAGDSDKLMTIPITRSLAEIYRGAWEELFNDNKIEAETEEKEVQRLEGEGGMDDIGSGVRLCFVPGVGHHCQNDGKWRIGASKLLSFYRQL